MTNSGLSGLCGKRSLAVLMQCNEPALFRQFVANRLAQGPEHRRGTKSPTERIPFRTLTFHASRTTSDKGRNSGSAIAENYQSTNDEDGAVGAMDNLL